MIHKTVRTTHKSIGRYIYKDIFSMHYTKLVKYLHFS